jgi:hypothetical protein
MWRDTAGAMKRPALWNFVEHGAYVCQMCRRRVREWEKSVMEKKSSATMGPGKIVTQRKSLIGAIRRNMEGKAGSIEIAP